MFSPSHSLAGIALLKGLNLAAPETFPLTGMLVLYSLIVANLPDIDALRFKTLKDHHNSLSHTPIFWIGLAIILYGSNAVFSFVPMVYIHLLLAQTLFHLFADYITARTTGPRLLYPFSKKNYGIVGLKPEHGDFHLSSKEGWKKFFKYYTKNKVMLGIEVGLSVIGLFYLIQVIF